MILITIANHDKFGAETYTIYDPLSIEYVPHKSELDREISAHMKIGTYKFSLLPQHPAYNKILLKRSIVTVKEDDKIVFRGDVVSVDMDERGVKKITCQNDMKWLADIPDVFSKHVSSETVYNIGDEDHYGFYRMVDDGETLDGQTIYKHQPTDQAESLRYEWDDFGFRPEHYGRKYTVEVVSGLSGDAERIKYQLPLMRIVIPRFDNLNYPVTLLYLGNIHLAQNRYDRYVTQDGWQGTKNVVIPETIDVPTEGTRTWAEPQEMEITEPVPLEDLNFCICHWYDPIKDPVTGGPVAHSGQNETILYTTLGLGLSQYQWKCSYTSATRVRTMVNEIFSEYGQTLYGYNRVVSAERRIYRGRINIDGDLDNSSVNTIYSNLSRWLDVTGGYASIRYVDGIAYLDLLNETGEKDDGIRVTMGDNVLSYAKSEDVLKLYTGVYVYGKSEREDNDLDLVGKAVTSQLPDFEFDTATGMIFHKEARRRYGGIVAFFEVSIDKILENEERGIQINYLYTKGCEHLKTLLESFVSFDVSSADPRVSGDGSPTLGNYYNTDIPLWGEPTYLPLTKIKENHLKPSANRYTFGDKKSALSDYTAKK